MQTIEVELVRVAFAVNLRHDILIIVIAKGTREFVVVHIRLGLSFSPATRHFVRIDQFEFAIRTFPSDHIRIGAGVGKQFQQKLP